MLHNLHILDYLFNKFLLQGLRERWLADPRFLQRLAIEETISITTTLIAQYERRGDRFWKEIEYVITDSVRGAVVDFFTVWLPAPTLSFRTLDAQVFYTSGCVFAVFLNPCKGCQENNQWAITGLKCFRSYFFPKHNN